MFEILFLICCGLLAGIVGGMFGVGGGIIIVPMLVFFMGFSQKLAQGTSTATLLLPIGFLAAYNYHKDGYVRWNMVLILALTFIVGAYFGSKIAISLDQKMLKRIFAGFLIVVACKMFWDTLQK